MNKKQLFAFFRQQDAPVLLQFLDAAYEEMTTDQREAVFGRTIRQTEPLHVDGTSLLTQVRQFQRDSLAGKYYAPFDINSKNFMHVPEETKAWFEQLGDLLTDRRGFRSRAITPTRWPAFRFCTTWSRPCAAATRSSLRTSTARG